MTAERAPDFDLSAVMKVVGKVGHTAALGLRYVDHGDAWCALALDYAPDLASDADTGILASGPIISLMDMATSMSVWVRLGRFAGIVTLDLRIDYLRPAVPGKTLIGRAECYRVTRRVAFVRGIAHEGDVDRPVAHVAGTFMLTEAK